MKNKTKQNINKNNSYNREKEIDLAMSVGLFRQTHTGTWQSEGKKEGRKETMDE